MRLGSFSHTSMHSAESWHWVLGIMIYIFNNNFLILDKVIFMGAVQKGLYVYKWEQIYLKHHNHAYKLLPDNKCVQ